MFPKTIDSAFISIFGFFCIYKFSIPLASEDTSEYSLWFGSKILFNVSNVNLSLSKLIKVNLISSSGYESDNLSGRHRTKIPYKY